jgi:hypothetical protein
VQTLSVVCDTAIHVLVSAGRQVAAMLLSAWIPQASSVNIT